MPLRQATRALGVAGGLHALDLAAQLGHPLADATAVGFDLRLAGTTQAHAAVAAGATTGLPRHRFTPATQPRQHVLHLRERDLRLALPRGRVLGEDVEDQGGPVDDLHLHDLLQRRELGGGELAVADDGVGAGIEHHLAQFVGLAGADVGGGVGTVAALDEALEHLRAGGLGERRQLGHARLGLRGGALGPDADEHHALEAQLAVLDLGDVGEFGGQPGDPAQRAAVLELHFADGRIRLPRCVRGASVECRRRSAILRCDACFVIHPPCSHANSRVARGYSAQRDSSRQHSAFHQHVDRGSRRPRGPTDRASAAAAEAIATHTSPPGIRTITSPSDRTRRAQRRGGRGDRAGAAGAGLADAALVDAHVDGAVRRAG